LRKIKSISGFEEGYLKPLSHLAQPPATLYIRGELPKKRAPTVAIIGTRRPTAYGKEITHQIASALARRGVVIVSGLAFGIDAAAHQAALDAGGTTLALMPGGLHEVYPRTHRQLGKDIVVHGGALISEYPPGTEARRYHFLARNRLISGVADAILIPEATERSGTLSTVAHALEQNKEIFAVPGPITSLTSRGPNKLIQQGARVATCAEDILEVVAPELLETDAHTPLGDSPLEQQIIDSVTVGIRDQNEIGRILHTPADELLRTLTIMELKGTLKHLGGGRWTV